MSKEAQEKYAEALRQQGKPKTKAQRDIAKAKKRALINSLNKKVEYLLNSFGLKYTKEVKFFPNRKFSFDFLIDGTMIAIEVEGGIYSGGGHTRGKHYTSDCEKYNLAILAGYQVFRLTREQIEATCLYKDFTGKKNKYYYSTKAVMEYCKKQQLDPSKVLEDPIEKAIDYNTERSSNTHFDYKPSRKYCKKKQGGE